MGWFSDFADDFLGFDPGGGGMLGDVGKLAYNVVEGVEDAIIESPIGNVVAFAIPATAPYIYGAKTINAIDEGDWLSAAGNAYMGYSSYTDLAGNVVDSVPVEDLSTQADMANYLADPGVSGNLQVWNEENLMYENFSDVGDAFTENEVVNVFDPTTGNEFTAPFGELQDVTTQGAGANVVSTAAESEPFVDYETLYEDAGLAIGEQEMLDAIPSTTPSLTEYLTGGVSDLADTTVPYGDFDNFNVTYGDISKALQAAPYLAAAFEDKPSAQITLGTPQQTEAAQGIASLMNPSKILGAHQASRDAFQPKYASPTIKNTAISGAQIMPEIERVYQIPTFTQPVQRPYSNNLRKNANSVYNRMNQLERRK